jgi:hypothetical protein
MAGVDIEYDIPRNSSLKLNMENKEKKTKELPEFVIDKVKNTRCL